MAYLIAVKRGKVLVHNGFRYQKNKVTASAIWWRCWRKACGAYLKTNIFDLNQNNPDIEFITDHAHHGHGEDDAKIQSDMAREELKQSILDDTSRPIKQAYIVRGISKVGVTWIHFQSSIL